MTDGKKKYRKESGLAEAKAASIALLSTADRIRAFFESVCAPFNITAQQYNVLRILRGAGPEGLPTLTIAERMIERAPGITRMIDRLESKGLVEREVCPSDRRCVYCRITRKGLDLLASLDEPIEKANRVAFGGLSKAEIEQLTALLLKARKPHE
ncbi:MAG TPA: MarR family transcriptional regulator [Blastocatellia bacterium]|nr:MarR family transcriptional regulator [Blastocatellia bacterium]